MVIVPLSTSVCYGSGMPCSDTNTISVEGDARARLHCIFKVVDDLVLGGHSPAGPMVRLPVGLFMNVMTLSATRSSARHWVGGIQFCWMIESFPWGPPLNCGRPRLQYVRWRRVVGAPGPAPFSVRWQPRFCVTYDFGARALCLFRVRYWELSSSGISRRGCHFGCSYSCHLIRNSVFSSSRIR